MLRLSGQIEKEFTYLLANNCRKNLKKEKKESLRVRFTELTLPLPKTFLQQRTLIVTYLGASVKEYLENYLIFLEENQWYCPVCSAKMSFHGWYRRKIITLDGTITRIPIARYRCSNCRQPHAIFYRILLRLTATIPRF